MTINRIKDLVLKIREIKHIGLMHDEDFKKLSMKELQSIDIIELIMELEVEFCIEIEDSEIASLKTMEDLIELVERKNNDQKNIKSVSF